MEKTDNCKPDQFLYAHEQRIRDIIRVHNGRNLRPIITISEKRLQINAILLLRTAWQIFSITIKTINHYSLEKYNRVEVLRRKAKKALVEFLDDDRENEP